MSTATHPARTIAPPVVLSCADLAPTLPPMCTSVQPDINHTNRDGCRFAGIAPVHHRRGSKGPEGCMLEGNLRVKRVPGNFHVQFTVSERGSERAFPCSLSDHIGGGHSYSPPCRICSVLV